jgi:penicillin-binding protein 2
MVASFARGETQTKPTLLHDPKRAPLRDEPIGLPPAAYNAILEGMKQCYQIGTGKLARVDELSGAAESGTAQKGRIEVAWLVCFAPVENPQIAIAVALEGEEDKDFGGGAFAGPVAHAILTAWKEKQDRPKQEPVKVSAQ